MISITPLGPNVVPECDISGTMETNCGQMCYVFDPSELSPQIFSLTFPIPSCILQEPASNLDATVNGRLISTSQGL